MLLTKGGIGRSNGEVESVHEVLKTGEIENHSGEYQSVG
jgi:hypothetical protein